MSSRSKKTNTEFNGNGLASSASKQPSELPPAKHRFEDGFGTLWAVAEVLTEAICGKTRQQAEHEDSTAYEALNEFQKLEARNLNTQYRRMCGHDLPSNSSAFHERHQAIAESLLMTARQEDWLITDQNGVPQVPPKRFGYINIKLVRDWFAKGRARFHTEYARALDAALCESEERDRIGAPHSSSACAATQQPDPSSRPALKTGEIARVFSFLPTLQKALGDVNNHGWVAQARVTRGKPPHASTWCPLILAEAIWRRTGHEADLKQAFATEPALRPWRDAWQEKLRERNAFGR